MSLIFAENIQKDYKTGEVTVKAIDTHAFTGVGIYCRLHSRRTTERIRRKTKRLQGGSKGKVLFLA